MSDKTKQYVLTVGTHGRSEGDHNHRVYRRGDVIALTDAEARSLAGRVTPYVGAEAVAETEPELAPRRKGKTA